MRKIVIRVSVCKINNFADFDVRLGQWGIQQREQVKKLMDNNNSSLMSQRKQMQFVMSYWATLHLLNNIAID